MNEVRDSVYFVGPTEASGPLYNMIQKGEFVALYGARASGKSTRVDQAMIKLESEGYVCIIIENLMLFSSLTSMMHYLEQMMTLNPRNIKNSKRYYALWSSVAIGSLSILFLKSDKINVSPFSVKEPFRNPNFTLAQVESLYKDYEDDAKLTIVPEVIKDINERTNGMVDDFIKPDAKEALDLLRSVFLGFFDFVQIHDKEERRLADFLTVEGVLMRENENEFSYRTSSIFVDELIRRQVIPVCRPLFDKTIIRNAFNRSFKTALVKVDGCHYVKVPRESVYDAELIRILVNWIIKECNFQVTGQWHLIDHNDKKDEHYYSDITITSQHQTVVLELLASATKNELNEHFKRMLDYAKMLSANDIWIVNFTCEDDATKKPHWPPNDENQVIQLQELT
ncbi:hypothetical protein RhiirA4_543937 [Rhizophagus irregularis]|uniref:Uncharacterized protein n=1 Tax=Rhizophagus irregularis TaxID=588596 RepID=A0A2I1GL97_9GLOM|nr:hypothetical protein RhiirA4_543937 [Rhizophagus irregularis]